MVSLRRQIKWKARRLLLLVLLLQLMTFAAIYFDVPFLRQTLSFISFTFIPGLLFAKILKLDKLGTLETILFSMGLGIACLMLVGLLVNELGQLVGFSKPLSTWPLVLVFGSITILSSFLISPEKDGSGFGLRGRVAFSAPAFALLLLPALSIVGAILVSASGSNLVLLLMMLAISAFVVVGMFSEKALKSQLYPLALFAIALALLFHTSLVSPNLNGFDIHLEYHVFKLTQDASYWNSNIPYLTFPTSGENAMLSVTVLPSILSTLMNLDGVWVFKIIYPLIFSLVPLGLYRLYQSLVGKKLAFLSVFFFIANITFYTEMLQVARQMIAELFYILLFLVLWSRDMSRVSRSICFIVFSAALVVSHYSTSYVFMFFIFSVFVVSIFSKTTVRRKVTATFVGLFFTLMFAWYLYVQSSGTFYGLLNVAEYVGRHFFTEFFNPTSRGEIVLSGLGVQGAASTWHLLGRAVAYITQALIVVGFAALVLARKKFPDREYLLLATLNLALLGMNIIMPYFASAFNMTRFYHLELFFLAPLFVLGCVVLLKLAASRKISSITISKVHAQKKAIALILIVLISFFLFQSNFIYEVSRDDSWSIALSKYRMDLIHYRYLGIVDDEDVFGARWLSSEVNLSQVTIYADAFAGLELSSYAMIDLNKIEYLSNSTRVDGNSVVYLRIGNTIFQEVWGEYQIFWNATEIYPMLQNLDRIYSNGGSEIYFSPDQ